ncbi:MULTISPECIES: prepilin-type N-terminal cleavage/methylation domain-containing protein [Marinobacter]|uniref:Prepilin-type N-terminal cleavage/methylation domain-containing protein n=1 Tax=Marinobacter shengliensis TaxID=1389223 RepID=A0ABV4W9Z8_9GAMM|nr:prepilin-type N-terminal cleavage/methylation domain-containing protein [Marinobacter sp.]MAO13645.1 pilin [Marinobacter sp.]|tara:strand:+ start:737 stop:1258 length:522 start_codon:yes stop_codon:yes gene_type:complete
MMKYNSKQKQKGFTLIELVVVIAILAILAAFALPRFAQLSEQAHQASIKGTAGALSAGVALAKAQWVANGQTGAVSAVDGFGDGDVAVNEDGWATSTDGTTTAPNQARCVQIWRGLMQSNAPTIDQRSAANANAEYWAAVSNTTACEYEYQLDGQNSTITYDTADGSIVTVIN